MKMTVVQFLLVWTPPPRLCRSVLLSNRSTPTYWHLGYLCWLVLCYTNYKDTLGSRLHIPAVGHLHCAEVLDSTVPLIQWTVVWKLVSQTVQCWALRIVTDYKKKRKKCRTGGKVRTRGEIQHDNFPLFFRKRPNMRLKAKSKSNFIFFFLTWIVFNLNLNCPCVS